MLTHLIKTIHSPSNYIIGMPRSALGEGKLKTEGILTVFYYFDHYYILVLDSWGKLPPRVLNLHTNWMGAYDECVSMNFTKYCSSNMKIYNMVCFKYFISDKAVIREKVYERLT